MNEHTVQDEQTYQKKLYECNQSKQFFSLMNSEWSEATLKTMIKNGYDPNFCIESNLSLIHCYIGAGLRPFVDPDTIVKQIKYLVKNGANINALDSNNKTPLHWACLMREPKYVKVLIDYGAKLNLV